MTVNPPFLMSLQDVMALSVLWVFKCKWFYSFSVPKKKKKKGIARWYPWMCLHWNQMLPSPLTYCDDVFQLMINPDPTCRPSATDLIRHPVLLTATKSSADQLRVENNALKCKNALLERWVAAGQTTETTLFVHRGVVGLRRVLFVGLNPFLCPANLAWKDSLV